MELVILMGVQASGKTTFYRTHFARTHMHVSRDCFRNNRRPGRRQQQLVSEALEAGRSVVVDNTRPRASDRGSLIELGRRCGARIVGYYFESQVAACLERNRARTGRARVPDVAIFATVKKLELPSRAEGFDRLYRVRITGPMQFEIRDWTEEPCRWRKQDKRHVHLSDRLPWRLRPFRAPRFPVR